MFSRITFLFVVLLAFCFGTAPNSAAQSSSTLTVEICCTSQQKVDQPHGVTLEVQKPDGTTASFSVFVAAGTKAKDVAGQLAGALRSNGVNAGDPTPNTHPRFAAGTAWDVPLPPGYVLTKAKVQKRVDGHWQEDDGHMKIRVNRKKVSNHHDVAGGLALPLTDDSTSDDLSFSTLDFTQDAWSGDSKAMEVYLRGVDAQGVEFSYWKTIVYEPGDSLPADDFADIGDFLSSLGMTVTFPASSKMHVEVWPSGLSVQEVEFTMYDATLPAVNDSEAAWGLDAE